VLILIGRTRITVPCRSSSAMIAANPAISSTPPIAPPCMNPGRPITRSDHGIVTIGLPSACPAIVMPSARA